jgi:hypothetical protein
MLAANVPEWLAKSRQVATGNRRRVLEDGDDVMSSSDEDDPNMVPDREIGMYTSEMDPKAGPRILSQAEALRQRLIAKASREAGFPDPPQSFRLSTDAQTFPSEAQVDTSVTRSRAVTDSTPDMDGSKAASSQRESADQLKGALLHTEGKDRRVQGQRSQPQLCKPEVKRAELEACDQGAIQGKRIRVLHTATLPKPES